MYKVLIADDNEITRISLKNSIDWEELQCELTGEAVDGLEVMELFTASLPDIVILDIRMPGRNGLEAAKLMIRQQEHIKVIIITGYNDFEYAQKGIHIGVFEFLLKPVNNEELTAAILRAQKMLRREQGIQQEQARLLQNESYIMEQLKKTNSELERKQFGDYIDGCFCAQDHKRECSRYAVMIIKQLTEEEAQANGDGSSTLFKQYQRQIADKLERYNGVKIIDLWRDNCVVLLFLFQKVSVEREYNLELLRMAAQIYEKNLTDYTIENAIGISKVYREYPKMAKAYEEACLALNSRFFLENKHVIHIATIQSRSVTDEYEVMKQLEALYEAVRRKEQNVREYLNQIFTWIRADKNFNISYVKNILVHICITVKQIVSENRIADGGMHVNEMIHQINRAETLSSALEYVEEYIDSICQNQLPEEEYSPATRRLLDYLKSNYHKKISLQEAADYVGLSASQVCRIMKADTGETFITLLNKIRLQTAIQMLKEGNYKIYEVAEMCGFTNYAYFYQLFRKETGKSPKNYY